MALGAASEGMVWVEEKNSRCVLDESGLFVVVRTEHRD